MCNHVAPIDSIRTQNVLGEKGRRIRELTAVVQKRFGFPEGSVEVSTELIIHSFDSSHIRRLHKKLTRCAQTDYALFLSSFMLRKLPPGACVPSPKRSLCVTSCLEAWLSVGKHQFGIFS